MSQCLYRFSIIGLYGRLDSLKATSNKKSFEWVKQCCQAVKWEPVARWVKDGKFYTSSGVSAGMDMALGFIADYYGNDLAQDIANHTEYHWQKDPSVDNFARIYGYK